MEKSRIFLSWSGERSKQVATILGGWLEDVLQTVDPFMSDTDIAAGDVWFDEIGNNLEISKFAIICVTPENVDSKWLHFEAGAIGMSRTDGARGAVVPYLFDLRSGDLAPPLSLFQAAVADKSGTLRLVHALNNVLPVRLDAARLERTFDRWWDDLATALAAIPAPAKGEPASPGRSERDLLEELLELARQGSSPNRLEVTMGDLKRRRDALRDEIKVTFRPGGLGTSMRSDGTMRVHFSPPSGKSVGEVQQMLDQLGAAYDVPIEYLPGGDAG